jgi:hypothetical protein
MTLINTIAIITVALSLLALCILVNTAKSKLAQLQNVLDMFVTDTWMLHDDDDFDTFKVHVLGDLQQIKTRLAWSKKREKKDLKQERTR